MIRKPVISSSLPSIPFVAAAVQARLDPQLHVGVDAPIGYPGVIGILLHGDLPDDPSSADPATGRRARMVEGVGPVAGGLLRPNKYSAAERPCRDAPDRPCNIRR